MKIVLPEMVEEIIHTLEEHGFEAYAVGGCVRDSILGRKPADWDITTSAKPEMIKRLFPKTIDTGLQHGTVTVMKNHVGYEVTTYRIDGEYEDHRHPKSVEYTDELKKDLERRDFTINAMAYNHKRGLVDIFNGVRDLESKIIRCVGEAGARFDEDALRMLRAIRFSSQLDFEIEENTRSAILPTKIYQCGKNTCRAYKAANGEKCRNAQGSVPDRYDSFLFTGIGCNYGFRTAKSASCVYGRGAYDLWD